MSDFPADIMEAARTAAGNCIAVPDIAYNSKIIAGAILEERKRCDIACQTLIDEYVKAERKRCANSVWDFYYGEKRGHVTPEEFAEFLQRNPKP